MQKRTHLRCRVKKKMGCCGEKTSAPMRGLGRWQQGETGRRRRMQRRTVLVDGAVPTMPICPLLVIDSHKTEEPQREVRWVDAPSYYSMTQEEARLPLRTH